MLRNSDTGNMKTINDFTSDSLYQKTLLSPLGLNRDNSFVLWMLLLFLTILSGGLYIFDGNMSLVAGMMYMTLILFLSFIRIDFSLYLFMLSVMVFDQFAIPGFSSFTHDVGFFNNFKEISYVPYFDAGIISPFELHLIFISLALLTHASFRRSFEYKPIAVWVAFAGFFLCLLFTFINGLRGGGDLFIAMWEVRALFYLCLMFVLVPQIIDTKIQIKCLFWVFIAGITFKAIQGIIRFVELGFTTGRFDVLTNHEDALFMVTLFVLIIGFLVFKSGGNQKTVLLYSLVPLFLGFYVAQRRAAYASLMVCIAAVIILLPPVNRIKFLKYFLPVLAVLILYGFVFWNDTGTFGRPVQMIKSGLVEPDKETNFRDYSSNLYREIENYNLAQTVVNNPVLGTGFGKKYEQPIQLADIRFTLRDYIPHNQIYWVLVKMGAIGFFAFWFFFNAFVAKGTQVYTRLKDPYLKVITLVIVIAVINQMVVSFYDLQLTYFRNMLYLGCLMGLLPVINKIEPNSEAKNGKQGGGSDG